MSEQKPFVHLHLHTEYSLLDGATKISELFRRADELGMPAVAMTDHGNMFGADKFFKAAVALTDPKADPYEFLEDNREFKVKPIIGCEVYMCDDMKVKSSVGGKMPKFNHLVLLCKNETGYKNLIKIVSRGYTEGLYYKPRVDFSVLEGRTEGLICLSACVAGAIPQAILAGDMEKADALVKKFKNMFGEDFYIEIQDHNIKEQKLILPHLVSLAKANGVKIVATNDVHYLRKKDATAQKVLQCIAFKNTMVYNPDDEEENGGGVSDQEITDDGYFPTKEFYMKSYDEMLEVFPEYPEALDVTVEIANKCKCDFFKKEPLLPPYRPADGSTPAEFLRKLTYDGLKLRYKEMTDEIRERAEYELNIIDSMGFVEYFLIVWDFIHYAETHGIPVGPGRGSGVGSIVAYAIGITKVDPLRYSLIFERFLNPERVSNPDFDIDFCVDRREDVIKYVIEKYGENNVSQIVTFGTLASKAAVKDVGRVFNYPYAEVDKITKLIPKMMGKLTIAHILGLKTGKNGEDHTIRDLRELYNGDSMARSVLDMAMQVEGMPRQTGMHAAGVIICRDDISDHVPMAKSGDGIVTTEFDMVECEELGLLKMDFLGLRTLTDIKKAIDYVKQTKGITVDFYNDCNYDDDGVFKLIGEGDTHAVFQLEGEGMKRFMRDLRPSSLEDVIAGISLYRPGPMEKIGEYVANKKNPANIKYSTPLLKPILDVTYGVMVYQEQVMQIVRSLAGYNYGRADNVRRMMSKKKHEAMEKEREVFLHGLHNKKVDIPGCIANGVPEDVANAIYDDMISFASYAFNKSHAAAYAYLSYQTAYLKRYHTVEFVTAVLNNRITNIDEITNYLTYLKERGYEVFPPNINKSFVEFSVENGGVRIGMAAIKNVGAGVTAEIVRERDENGEFKGFTDFVERMQSREVTVNKKVLESLIFAGAFDCFGNTRAQLIQVYETVMDRADKDAKKRKSGQFSFFDMVGGGDALKDDFTFPDVPEFSLAEKLKHEREVAGVYLTGHPLSEYTAFLRTMPYNTGMLKVSEDDESGEIADGMQVTIGGMLVEAERKFVKQNRELGIGKLEDLYGSVEVMLTSAKIPRYRSVFVPEALVTITGRLSVRDNQVSIWADTITPWGNTVKSRKQKMICVYLPMSDKAVLEGVRDVFAAYPGQDKAYIKDTETGTLYDLKVGVEICDMLRCELAGIVPADKISVK